MSRLNKAMLHILLLTVMAQTGVVDLDAAERNAKARLEANRRNPPPPIPTLHPPSQTPRTTVPSTRPTTPAALPKPRNDPATWITDADRPTSLQGVATVRVQLSIAKDGMPTNCRVLYGINGAIDDLTCRLLVRRARFIPAKNAAGLPIRGSTERIVLWRVPQRSLVELDS